eukprot:scaffold57584_cov75-Phaeocystis_antarctica.AAC.1
MAEPSTAGPGRKRLRPDARTGTSRSGLRQLLIGDARLDQRRYERLGLVRTIREQVPKLRDLELVQGAPLKIPADRAARALRLS